jgi:hypothetical protein
MVVGWRWMVAREARTQLWSDKAKDLGRALREANQLTVFLGAGASISSGAPDTAEVERLLGEMFRRFGEPSKLVANLHRVSGDDKAIALRDRFKDLVPYVGYRCLAALGRTRRVLVINMNWDPLLLSACDRLGVPCLSFDLRDQASWPTLAELREFVGIVDVHFHGELDNPRHGGPDTRWQTPEQVAYLKEIHNGARRVYLGLSLNEDHDVSRLGQALDTGRAGWVYGYFRGPADDGPQIAMRVSALHASDPVFEQAPDLDFDKVLLLLTDELAEDDRKWEDHERHLRLPPLDEIVLPRVEVLAPALDDRCSVLIGEAQIGKSTAARLIGYLHQTLTPDRGAVRYVDSLSAPAALGAPEMEDAADMLVLESPFGEADHMATAPTIIDQINTWTALGSAAPKLLITSRVGAYDDSPLKESRYRASDPTPAKWYRIEELREFASAVAEGDPRVVDRVEQGWLDTPARIVEMVAGVDIRAGELPEDRELKAVDERRQILGRNPDLGRLCAVVRLQEFGGEPLAESEIRTLLGGRSLPKGPAHDLMLHHYAWDGRQRIRLVHALDRDATDGWIGDHRDLVEAILDEDLCPPALTDGWDAWTLCDDVRRSRFDEVRRRDPAVIAQHLSAMLDVRPDADVLALVDSAELDEWSAHDLSYSLLRLWGDLPDPERRGVLEHLLSLEDAFGTYGVLEAILYLRGATPQEVVDAVHHQLWKFVREGTRRFEIALAIDGFAWRVPPEPEWVQDWTSEALRQDSTLAGVLPVIAAYHPGGAEEAGLRGRLARARTQALPRDAAELAVRLVRWHFVHQSRARAMLARQHWLDKWYLCRSFLPAQGSTDSTDVLWLFQVLAGQGEPGWGFFAACFLMGGLQQALRADARDRAHEMLRDAGAGDMGVLAAAATYRVAGDKPFSATIQSHFKDDANRDRLLDSLSDGLIVEGFRLRPPRFAYWDDVVEIFKWLDIKFERLGPYQPSDLDSVTIGVKLAVDRCMERGIGTPELGAELVRKVALGDFRLLQSAAFRGDDQPRLEVLVENALRAMDA